MIHSAESHFTKDPRASVHVFPDENGNKIIIQASEFARFIPCTAWPKGEPRFEPKPVSDAHPVVAYVNDSRWVAQCECGSAQLVSKVDRRFFCVECLNRKVGGAWVKVIWPKNPQEIEAVLEARPFPKNRNWMPGESVAQLQAENRDHLGNSPSTEGS